MASLPNKSFVFNYNAKNYNPNTFTIPNETGASLNMDMVWTATTSTIRSQISFSEDHISIPSSAFSFFDFSTSDANPINNTTSAPAMTIVAKFKLTSGGSNFLCNRGPVSNTGDNYNFMARVGSTTSGKLSLHTANSNSSDSNVASYTPGTTVTAVWRVDTSRQISITNLTENISNTPFKNTWNGGCRWFTFFVWRNASGAVTETMAGDFYWCYFSKEYLTDEEIQQVVNYNESSFGPDRDSDVVATSGGTVQVTLSAETTWSASTASDWITISPITGSGETNVTLTVAKNLFTNRTGAVTFTDGEDTALFTIYQGGTDGLVPYKKIFRNENRIN